MANGPKYRVPFRRRRQGKTNYHRRLKLIISERNRLVVRCSNNHTTVQVIEAKPNGDYVLAQSHSSQLKKFDWNFHTKNIPSAYLTGFLCGINAKKAGLEDAILDVGILVHNKRVKAAFRGFLDTGIIVPHDSNWFSKSMEERIKGTHIQNYAKLLSKEDPKKYKKIFSNTLKNKGDPTKMVKIFEKLKEKLEKKVE